MGFYAKKKIKKSNKNKYKSSFQDEWLSNEVYKKWVKKVTDDKHKAYCKVCMKSFSVSGLGVKALEIYSKGKIHMQKCPSNQQQLQFQLDKSDEPADSSGNKDQSTPTCIKQTTAQSCFIKQNAIKAEIMWALEVIMSNYSYRSCASKSELFSVMFNDSDIAKDFSLGKTKLSYNICYGIAPHFRGMLIDCLKEVPFYSLSFDESYNNALKKGQMDLHVRYWEDAKNIVVTRYLDSSFMGKSSAQDVYTHFKSCAKSLEDAKYLQISSDGPNVNLAFLEILKDSRTESDCDKKLINIGTCGLHTMHNAFKHCEKASTWDVKKLLSAMYKIFHESPSCRADYEKLTSALPTDYPLKFSSHRWAENENVAKKAYNVLPKLLEVVDFWKSLPKSKQPGQGKAGANKSYDTLLLKRNDPLVPVKLRFFEETAKIINAFLVQFQTQSPMVPFLVDCLENIVRGFCDRFILPDIMKKANTSYKLTKLDVMDKNIHMRDYHFSFSINHELRELKEKGKINDSKLRAFKMEAKDFISTLCNHLLSKSPLTSYFARCAKCLDPTTMGEMPDVCKQSFHKMLQKLVEY